MKIYYYFIKCKVSYVLRDADDGGEKMRLERGGKRRQQQLWGRQVPPHSIPLLPLFLLLLLSHLLFSLLFCLRCVWTEQ